VKTLISVLIAGILMMYPFAVYYGLQYLPPRFLALILLALLFLRIALLKNNLAKIPWVVPATLLGSLALVFSLFTQSNIGFKLYPLLVNCSLLMVFSFSLFKPPSVIETFARLKEKNLNKQGIKYTEKVTLLWCVFFVVNGCISLYTALYSELEFWMLYNGFISYVLMGCLFAGEFLVRLKVKKHHKDSETQEPHLNE
jgi:uncharacterized membrane protein